MPRLITLLPCEKVIVDRDGMPSLISLFEHVNIAPSAGETIAQVPKETITFQHWAVFSEWEITADETTLNAVDQIFEIQFPDGAMAPIKGKIPFVFKNAGTYRNHQNIFGFPVGQEGTYMLRVWLEKDGTRISDVGVRKISVIHKIPTGAHTLETLGHAQER